MIDVLTRNLGLKILSIFLAFLLWIAVVNYDDPVIPKEFTDIPVKIMNEVKITSQKKTYEIKQGQTVDVTVKGKRSVVDRLDEKDIIVVANMEEVSITFAIPINVEVEKVEIVDYSPKTMIVQLEDIVTDYKVVTVETSGSPADNYFALSPRVTPNNIQITGPESKIALISKVLVRKDIDNAMEDITLTATPLILDDKGEEITGLTMSVDEVEVSIPIQKLKTVPIQLEPVGEVPEGYVMTDLSTNPNSVTLIGYEDKLAQIDRILIDQDIDLSNLTESKTMSINLEEKLPEGVSVHGADKSVSVHLTIEKLYTKSLDIELHDILVRYLPDNLQLSYPTQDKISVTFSATNTVLDSITVDSLRPQVNLRELEEGIHELNVTMFYSANATLVSEQPTVTIELTQAEEEATAEEVTTEDDTASNVEPEQ